MKYYADLITDSGEPLHFTVEAPSAHLAMIPLAAYCKGRFEASGKGADVEKLSRKSTRGVEYRGL